MMPSAGAVLHRRAVPAGRGVVLALPQVTRWPQTRAALAFRLTPLCFLWGITMSDGHASRSSLIMAIMTIMAAESENTALVRQRRDCQARMGGAAQGSSSGSNGRSLALGSLAATTAKAPIIVLVITSASRKLDGAEVIGHAPRRGRWTWTRTTRGS
jgi:hypothetical protein